MRKYSQRRADLAACRTCGDQRGQRRQQHFINPRVVCRERARKARPAGGWRYSGTNAADTPYDTNTPTNVAIHFLTHELRLRPISPHQSLVWLAAPAVVINPPRPPLPHPLHQRGQRTYALEQNKRLFDQFFRHRRLSAARDLRDEVLGAQGA